MAKEKLEIPNSESSNGKSIEKMRKNEVIEEVKTAQQQAQEAQAELERIATMNKEIRKLNNLLRHIRKVQEAMQLLAERLIERGEPYFARKLVARSMIHDRSKFSGIEWEYLVKEDSHQEKEGEKLQMAIHQHVMSNDHHPECWGTINSMSEEAIAEMVCDWYARSAESASNLREWIKKEALSKYEINSKGKIYKIIKRFVDLLVDSPLKTIKPKA